MPIARAREADRHYLDILKVAAMEGTSAVENVREELMAQPRGVLIAVEIKTMLESYRDDAMRWRDRGPLEASLADYDTLLGEQTEPELEAHHVF